ncbi:MAG: L-threonine 3-dehydrogenase [Candidatus Neomarinimicrobiota bacterium]|jgi:threonine 3-dehydrogenase|nr:L-threonine 3-dehydrogenase [Candidatus Neomarinimicrobiota bacterium]MEC8705612.1 L-threonine 3-dehydrogenase [Candidatus Neomarinimicrobiota bacterium]|tara:strand:+ start:5215 stop:6237 length:1023 start_codon:yes stop_codon:yes gene_type:complete
MKALVKHSPKEGIWMEDVPDPKCGPGEVRIRITHTAICGTDKHIFEWDEWAQNNLKLPLIVGHEFCGIIDEVGPHVTHYKVGDRVSGEGHITCGNCRNCRAGKKHLCPETIGVGVHRDGAFAEYLVIPESNVWPLHEDIPSEIAAFFDPLGNAVHTALAFNITGEDILICGAGPIGMMAAAICKFSGSRNIVVTDINDYRLNLAKDLGASRTVNPRKEDIGTVFEELGISHGFDVGLEMSGNPEAFNQMISLMYNGGNIALLGLLPNSTKVDWNKVIFKGLNIKGIYGREMYDTWYKMTQMIRSGLSVSKVLTHHFKIDDFQKAFKVIESGNCGKVVLEW